MGTSQLFLHREKPLHLQGVEPRIFGLSSQTRDHYAARTDLGDAPIKYTQIIISECICNI